MESGTQICFVLGAALRDPEVYPNPDTSDYQRSTEASKAMVFGVGTHKCAGQALTRAVARSALDVIAGRYSRVEVIGDPVWTNSDRHRNSEGVIVRPS